MTSGAGLTGLFTSSPSLQVGLALALGMVSQIAARHLRLPGIVVLLAVGVAAGPDGIGILHPEALGSALPSLVGFAVAVVLFEGGLALDLDALVHQALPVRRLITVGALVTAVGGALAARMVLGWSWTLSLLFGTLVIVTGPTVINPLLKRIRLQSRLATVLEGEGILGDAVGATIAVVTLEVLLAPPSKSLVHGLMGLAGRLGFGVLFGVLTGAVLSFTLSGRRLVPPGQRNVFALALLLALYELANALRSESGVLTAIVAGIWVGNRRRGELKALREFKEELTLLLIGMLFVLLAADVRLDDIAGLGWRGALVVALLMFVVRPANVWIATRNSGLTGKEKAFLSWLAPRGIVAAAVASHFSDSLADAGVPGGTELRALVFLVIAVTVTLQGLTGGPLARLLGLAEPLPTGWAIAGANPLARAIGRLLGAPGDVTLIDLNTDRCNEAAAEGFVVIRGNALDEATLGEPAVTRRAAFLAVTPNEEVNFIFARHVREAFRESRIGIALRRDAHGIDPEMLTSVPAEQLFDGPRRIDLWALRLERGQAVVEELVTEGAEALPPAAATASWLPLVWQRGGERRPWQADQVTRPGDRAYFAIITERRTTALAELAIVGWRTASTR
jgi:NhaP-type Na+/H+ or K+/H+ antiporter